MIHRIPCVVALSFLVLISPIRADNKPPSNTVRAQRVVRLRSNEEQERMNAAARIERIGASLSLKQTAGDGYNVIQFAADAVGVRIEQMLGMLELSYDPSAQTATIIVDLEHAPPAAKMCAAEAADLAVETLAQALDSGKVRGDFEAARYAMELMEKRKDESQQRIKAYQQQLTDQTGAVDVSPATLRQLLSSLQTQRESIQIDLQAKMERRNSLAMQISKFSKEIEDKIKDDPIAAELEKVVKSKEEDVARKQQLQQQGTLPQAELSEAIGAVAEARAKLLERREVATANAGGDIIAGWNKELMNLSVDLDELKARSAIIEDRLHRFAGTGDLIRELDEAESSMLEQNRQLTEMSRHVAEMEMEFRRHHVWLDQVSAKDEPAPATQPSK